MVTNILRNQHEYSAQNKCTLNNIIMWYLCTDYTHYMALLGGNSDISN